MDKRDQTSDLDRLARDDWESRMVMLTIVGVSAFVGLVWFVIGFFLGRAFG